ncbi:MAG: hypothetical protein WBC70_18775 [Candidatus Aminicenantales bacterium]
MRMVRKTTVVAAMAFWACLMLAAQQPSDMVGTWSGDATLEGMDEPNTLTLVLEMKEGKLAGHMTDQYEAIDAHITDIVLEQGTFSFSVTVLYGLMYGPDNQGTAKFKMKVLENIMKGDLEIPEMNAKGAWQATKKK